MSVYTALLHDGTVIPIDDGTYSMNIISTFETKEAFKTAWDAMTREALKTVEIQRNNETVGTFRDLSVSNIQIVTSDSDSFTAHFYFEQLPSEGAPAKTYSEQLADRIAALEESQDTQDGAIEDLGMAISDIAEGGE